MLQIAAFTSRFSIGSARFSFVDFSYDPLARLTNKHSQFKTFPQPCSNRTFSNCLSHNCPAKGWPDFAQGEELGLTYWTMLLAICASVDVSKYLDILTLDFFITLMRLPCWPEYKRILHQLLVLDILEAFIFMSMTFAAVIWDADDLFSVNTAYEPVSSFTMSPRSTTLPVFLILRHQLRILKWHRSINDAKWTFLPASTELHTITAWDLVSLNRSPLFCAWYILIQ